MQQRNIIESPSGAWQDVWSRLTEGEFVNFRFLNRKAETRARVALTANLGGHRLLVVQLRVLTPTKTWRAGDQRRSARGGGTHARLDV